MTERPNVTRRQKVERLDLLLVVLPPIHLFEGPQQVWTADRDLADGRRRFKSDPLCGKTEAAADDVAPHLRNPPYCPDVR